jgi:hypothetical protein
MADGDYVASGIGTLSASDPGDYASVDITLTGISATDIVSLSLEYVSDKTQTTTGDSFGVYFVKGTDKITVYANRPQTPAVKVHALVTEKS